MQMKSNAIKCPGAKERLQGGFLPGSAEDTLDNLE